MLLGCGRKYVSWLNGAQGQPIGSLHYFIPILEEVNAGHLSVQYRAFNRMQVQRLEKRWLSTQKNAQTLKEESAWENFSQPKPIKFEEKRDDVAFQNKELPGD
ncbi:MAG: hypothetical protein ACE5JX_03840 [Acidobacteriota bacterium]